MARPTNPNGKQQLGTPTMILIAAVVAVVVIGALVIITEGDSAPTQTAETTASTQGVITETEMTPEGVAADVIDDTADDTFSEGAASIDVTPTGENNNVTNDAPVLDGSDADESADLVTEDADTADMTDEDAVEADEETPASE